MELYILPRDRFWSSLEKTISVLEKVWVVSISGSPNPESDDPFNHTYLVGVFDSHVEALAAAAKAKGYSPIDLVGCRLVDVRVDIEEGNGAEAVSFLRFFHKAEW